MGPHLANNILNLGIEEQIARVTKELGLDLDEIIRQEEEPGLGNGGLGRLAACYLDSLATLGVPAVGYGIRYEFGIFDQEIRDGWQVEITDKWLRHGNPWEIRRSESAVKVGFGGHTEASWTRTGAIALSGFRMSLSREYRTIRRCWAMGAGGPTICACGPPRRRSRSSSIASTPEITRGRCRKRCSRRTSRRCCTRMTKARKANGCGWSNSTFSSPAHYRT